MLPKERIKQLKKMEITPLFVRGKQQIAKLKKILTTQKRVLGRLLSLRKNSDLLNSSSLFNPIWYLSNNPDVAKSRMNAAQHFLLYGGIEGRDPGPNFSSSWYLSSFSDVRKSEVNPLLHYLKFGKKEGRLTKEKGEIVEKDNYLAVQRTIGNISSFTTESEIDKNVMVQVDEAGKFLGEIKIVSVITQNNSSLIFKDTKDQCYLLKIYNDRNSYTNEIQASFLLNASEFRQYPRIVKYFNNSILFEYIDGYVTVEKHPDFQYLTFDDANRNSILEKLILKVFTDLQNLNTKDRKFDIINYSLKRKEIIQQLMKIAIIKHQITRNIYQKLWAYTNGFPFGNNNFGDFTHGDFNFANIIVSPNLNDYKIIDWEYADYSNRNRDYANFFMYLLLDRRFQTFTEATYNCIKQFDNYNPDLIIYYMLNTSLVWLKFPSLSIVANKFIKFLEGVDNYSDIDLLDISRNNYFEKN